MADLIHKESDKGFFIGGKKRNLRTPQQLTPVINSGENAAKQLQANLKIALEELGTNGELSSRRDTVWLHHKAHGTPEGSEIAGRRLRDRFGYFGARELSIANAEVQRNRPPQS